MNSFDEVQSDELAYLPTEQDWSEYEQWLATQNDGSFDDDYADDGQPDEYTEWQDVYGGDDWDHGQCEVDYFDLW